MYQSQPPDACGMFLTSRVENAWCGAVHTRQTNHLLRPTMAEPFFLVPALTRTRYVHLLRSETQNLPPGTSDKYIHVAQGQTCRCAFVIHTPPRIISRNDISYVRILPAEVLGHVYVD